MLQCSGTGSDSACIQNAVLWDFLPEWGEWIYRCSDIPCNQLSMCTGDQYSPQFLCWNWWCQQSGRSGKRLQLSGDAFTDEDVWFLIKQVL